MFHHLNSYSSPRRSKGTATEYNMWGFIHAKGIARFHLFILTETQGRCMGAFLNGFISGQKEYNVLLASMFLIWVHLVEILDSKCYFMWLGVTLTMGLKMGLTGGPHWIKLRCWNFLLQCSTQEGIQTFSEIGFNMIDAHLPAKDVPWKAPEGIAFTKALNSFHISEGCRDP